MIIWRGWGFLVPVVAFAVAFGTEFVVDSIAGAGTYSNSGGLFTGVALIVAGALIFAFAMWEERRNPPRVLVDKATGKEETQVSRSDLFFVPIRWWGLAGIVLGLVLVVLGLVQ